jgi:2',3'-cyclic-nucleotide 2'-phosphodiesterase (5'-nucleotidase family)
VHASVLVDAAGVKVGIVGVMTIDALRATLRANVQGLRVAPLAETVAAEAKKLRAAGAEVVIVGSHAGGSCTEFGDARDLSSCDSDAEMFRVAREVPRGLIDVIVAGHTHQALAHEVEGVTLIQAYSHGRAFSRVDIAFDRRKRRVVSHTPMAPVDICAVQDPATLACEPSTATASLPPTRYEGRVVETDARIEAAMAPALARVRALQATPLGLVLDTPIPRAGDSESTLGNLFADALRARTPGVDVAINNNFRGGLRADLPEGPLTFGRFYDTFPFDNRLVTLTLTGAELRRVFAEEVRRNRPGALAVSGVLVSAACAAAEVDIALRRPSGEPIRDDEQLVVVATDQLVQGIVYAPLELSSERRFAREDAPVMREVVEDWLQRHGGRLHASEFAVPGQPRWRYPSDATAPSCAL